MGQSASQQPKDIPCDEACLTAKGTYKAAYLKRRWAGTARDGYRYSVGYAPTSAATCRCGCKRKIAKGALRVGRSTPSPFDSEGGHADLTHFYSFEHAFGAFRRSRCSSRVPLKQADLAGAASIEPQDRRRLATSLAAFAAAWRQKCA
jgi:hypothetical protein